MDHPNVILNGKSVAGIENETILQLAERFGIRIPSLCHDPRLKPISSCFVCVVEIEGVKNLKPSCSTKIYEGIKITTDSPRIRSARKTALEMLLSHHYADCLAPCHQACPADVDAQGYISLIEKGLYKEAVGLIKETNPLPSICGRICTRPCEHACRRNLIEQDEPVGIAHLKRFAADYDLSSPDHLVPEIAPPTGKKVAIIGSGPAGLATAYFLQQKGHQVDIYEARSAAGGMLRHGIPEYRLPNDIVEKEITRIAEIGVRIHCGRKLGADLRYQELKENFDAVILAIGAGSGMPIGCRGDDAENILSGIGFVEEKEETGKKYDFRKQLIAVVGSDALAVNCARSAIRAGAKKTYLISPRKSLTAHDMEIQDALEEGVECLLSIKIVKIKKDHKGLAKSIICQKQEDTETSLLKRLVPFKWRRTFHLKFDYVIAATGKKTNAGFVDDINNASDGEKLKVNEQGSILTNKQTFQTGIRSVFAVGDAVNVAGNVIRAIAQAKTVSYYCHQFLTGIPLKTTQVEKKEFLSRKNALKRQSSEDYEGIFVRQNKEKMPKLSLEDRRAFKEVELGYQTEEVAKSEAGRCLECGCTEYHDCDLKKYATEYGADQKRFASHFKEYNVLFSHPFIEIDNNKCILCLRCIRICTEVVGANALSLVNRGINCYVAPSMEDPLSETTCESCGLCISTCPTGAITENIPYKPLPLKLEKIDTVCPYCSSGEEISLHHRNGFFVKVTGKKGSIVKDGNFCRQAKFGYRFLNDKNRLVRPMLKIAGKFEEIPFERAYDLIIDKIKNVTPDENVFFAGARLTHEEMYLIQKLARGGVKTNNVHSLHYLGRGEGYFHNSMANVPFDAIQGARKIYLIGAELSRDNAVVGFMVNQAKSINSIPVVSVTHHENSCMKRKVDQTIRIKSYYHFIKALNYYLIANGLENIDFLRDRCTGYEDYKRSLLTEDYPSLVRASGFEDENELIRFARDYQKETKSIIIFSEKEVSANTSIELFNLSMMAGNLGKDSSGLLALKEKNNSQGLSDMGIYPEFGVGKQSVARHDFDHEVKEKPQMDEGPVTSSADLMSLLKEGKLKNVFIFGEDPIGCAINKREVHDWFRGAGFVVLQDYFMTETAKRSDLLLPASFPVESGGSYANTQGVIQTFQKSIKAKGEKISFEQLLDLHERFGLPRSHDLSDVLAEAGSLNPAKTESCQKFALHSTPADNEARHFHYGCDHLMKYFEEFSR